jgi:hypothetical protein
VIRVQYLLKCFISFHKNETELSLGDVQAIRKYAGRTVRITPQHNSDIKQLLE